MRFSLTKKKIEVLQTSFGYQDYGFGYEFLTNFYHTTPKIRISSVKKEVEGDRFPYINLNMIYHLSL